MAVNGKKLVRALRTLDSTADIDEFELVVVIAFIARGQGRYPEKLAKGLGLSPRRVTAAWNRARDKGLIQTDGTSSDPFPVCEATAEGRRLATDALMALELAGYEPNQLAGLRADERKHPFASDHNPWL